MSRLALSRRRVLYGLATNERFEATARALPRIERVARDRARRYVAGETLADALTVSARLADAGISVAIDYFGEQVSDAAAAEAAADGYIALAEALAARADSGATVAVDLSHVGLDISTGFCREQLGRIAAALAGRRLDVGAEDSARTTATQALVLDLAGSGTPLQMTVQANLRRSARDWQALVASGVAIRLVKGAYVENAATAYRYGEDVDLAYLRLARDVHAAGGRLALATHDPVLREALLGLEGVAVEMLLGVRTADAHDLVARGIPVRLYVPYGRDWFRYWMRRVAESQGA